MANEDDKITNIELKIEGMHHTRCSARLEKVLRGLDGVLNANVEISKEFYMSDSKEKILDKSISYVVDCIDTVTAKIALVIEAQSLNIPIISSMGAGNKLDPSKFEITDIYKTSVCPLAKAMRKKLKSRGVKKLEVIYSKEEPIKQFSRCKYRNAFI